MLTFLYAFLGSLTAFFFAAVMLVGARRSLVHLLLTRALPWRRIRPRNRD